MPTVKLYTPPRRIGVAIALCGFGAVLAPAAWAAPATADIERAVSVMRSVGAEGRGNEAAGAAWKTLAAARPREVTQILAAMDEANPVVANWLSTAAEAVVDRALSSPPTERPVGELGLLVLDARHSSASRRTAYGLLRRLDATLADQMLPGFLNDPSPDLRREAVQALIDQAARHGPATTSAAALVLLEQALANARDASQIQAVARQLRDAGRPVELARRFGWLREWKVTGPFDNKDRKGFDTVFPPEQSVNLAAQHNGRNGPVGWTNLVSSDEMGLVDMNIPFGKLKETTAYAYTEVRFDSARDLELRVACKNAWKIWFNGRFLFGQNEYHRGTEIDHYRLPVRVAAGANTILVKLCQNEQVEDWTVEWQFQLRICDPTGAAVQPNEPATPRTASFLPTGPRP